MIAVSPVKSTRLHAAPHRIAVSPFFTGRHRPLKRNTRVSPVTIAVTHSMSVGLQGGETVAATPAAEEHRDDLYGDYDDLSVSTVTVGPNISEYEVG